jgi:thioredoxin reductase (NADPH)
LTSVTGLYVSGDLKANTRKQIYTAWDNAVSAASAINLLLRTKKRKALLDASD